MKKLKNLFLRQSYLDTWRDYERSLHKYNFIKWDYLILTASNDMQATAYREQIDERLQKGLLPAETKYAVLPDPGGKRVGSGGATFQVLKYIAEQEGGAFVAEAAGILDGFTNIENGKSDDNETVAALVAGTQYVDVLAGRSEANACEDADGKTLTMAAPAHPFKDKRILVIHSGGDSKRVPQYSACGKLFSPVPRELPDGRSSTLFDEFVVGMSGVPSRIREGMLVLSGDVLLLFNPLQIDAQFDGAAAISFKEPVSVGKDHGVYIHDGKDYVKMFLHKQSEEQLAELGAVNEEGNVDLDTGAVLLGNDLLEALYGLLLTDGRFDEARFRKFCNEEARISFYGDFLYPLAKDATLEAYYAEAAEGELNEALQSCRTEIWNAIHSFSLKLLCLSPAQFIHFGTTRELKNLMTRDVANFEFLDWRMQVNSAVTTSGYAAHNAYVGRRAKVGSDAYLENAYVIGLSEVGAGSILSHVRVNDRKVPANVVLHGIELSGGKYVTRIYGVEDNPKEKYICLTDAKNDAEAAMGRDEAEARTEISITAGKAENDTETLGYGTADTEKATAGTAGEAGKNSAAAGRGTADTEKGIIGAAGAEKKDITATGSADCGSISLQNVTFLGSSLQYFICANQLSLSDLWDNNETYLWFAKLYPVCDTQEEALDAADLVYRMARGEASTADVYKWKSKERTSLYSGFNAADLQQIRGWEKELEDRILARKFIWALEDGTYYKDALQVFGKRGISQAIFSLLVCDAAEAEFSLKIRIYYALSAYMKETGAEFILPDMADYSDADDMAGTAQRRTDKIDAVFTETARRSMSGSGTKSVSDAPAVSVRYDALESACFETIQNVICSSAEKKLPDSADYGISKARVDVKLPLRVNWGGGWTDTPPHCNEKGGVVLNAAIKLKGIYPVQVTVKRLDDLHVEFESKDIGVFTKVYTAAEIQDCHNPYDSFALHKAALIACGIIPVRGAASLPDILKRLGGGIYLSTQVYGVPKGSGLGTSSILAGACVKGIFEFLGIACTDNELYELVLGMEQIMNTGGGWQDQVGGLAPGIKLISTRPGIEQNLSVEQIYLDEATKQELKDRFALIYTGQRRLARNLLRDVVGGYIGARPDSIRALKEMKTAAVLMRFALEQGDVDEFARLLNWHWELSCMLDAGTTNTCIDQILLACEDLIDGKFVAGAGGGGFLQVIRKKGVTNEQLHRKLREVFQDSGVDVWECELLL